MIWKFSIKYKDQQWGIFIGYNKRSFRSILLHNVNKHVYLPVLPVSEGYIITDYCWIFKIKVHNHYITGKVKEKISALLSKEKGNIKHSTKYINAFKIYSICVSIYKFSKSIILFYLFGIFRFIGLYAPM